MKRFEFSVDAYQAEWMLSAVRSKRDLISLLMRTIKIMLLLPLPIPEVVGKVILHVDKMSRLFYVFEGKIFSINFPYTVIEDNGLLVFRSIHQANINSAVTSNVLSVLEINNAFDNPEILSFAEPISDICQYDEDFWSLLLELLMYEDGYIRFDHDEERSNAQRHPIDHLDIFYTSGSTFKIGMYSCISHDYFCDLLNLNTDCHFLASIS